MDLVCKQKKECRKMSDEEIVNLIKKNKQCYVCLMERSEQKIIRYIKRISGVSEETAEDITQNIFLKVYSNNLSDMDIWGNDDKKDYICSMEHVLKSFFEGRY